MGFRFEYVCNSCGTNYIGDVGGGRYFELFRCIGCDDVKIVQKTPMMMLPERCKCGAQYGTSVDPKCPKCKGKGERLRVISAYD